jgi:VanZ family protein
VIVRGSGKTYTVLTAIIAGVLVYLELYPCTFRVPTDDNGALRTLLESWSERPSRGDLIANILAYIPLGFCATRSVGFPRNLLGRVPLIVLAGSALSVAFELAQYFVEGRVTSAADVCTNALGVLLGSAAAVVWAKNADFVLWVGVFSKPIPFLLLGAWTAYRTYPYVPTTDLHKFWQALKPIVLSPSLQPYDLGRHTTIWLTLFALIEATLGRRRSLLGAVLFAGFLIGSRISIVDKALSMAEVAGAGIALCIWPVALLLPLRLRASLLALTFGGYILVERLQPFLFQRNAREFGWLPFCSFMTGSLELNLMAFLEKSFLYGGLLFLLGEAGWRLRNSAIFVALALFATSWAETYLPGRSAEITDAVMVLLVASAFALLPSEPRLTGETASAATGGTTANEPSKRVEVLPSC